jgi:hypothetical protein
VPACSRHHIPFAGLTKNEKNHDWNITLSEISLHLECKFIPASWPKLVDGQGFSLMRGSIAKKASAQLPKVSASREINIVAVTGMSPVDDSLRRLCAEELHSYSNVHVVVYSTLPGETTVFSLSLQLAREVHKTIERRPADQFGGFTSLAHFRPELKRRQAARLGPRTSAEAEPRPSLAELRVEPLPPRILRYAPPDKYPYRFNMKKRLPTGEPIFEWIPPFALPRS